MICAEHGKASINLCMCTKPHLSEACYKCHLENYHLNRDEGQVKA